ncbi:T9SS type A sorting domain-containing protein [Hymenobacter cellulosilyticus]|uniref:T9SS type A sorting domain-containing protein n=1 Tax=Hymenobacter cellulosilyticus TaxID=2932248 RepID=A0A8T9QBI6_9BACT|nr:T9SS type A sorting domain-containing protein [Hymenobacter cellulosilyticus]UOQ74867.1 T9SS type A sorting domain-containing protein [Hymenobacter cellulosilyticus]
MTPSGTTPVRVDSVLFTSYVTGSTSNTKMAVVWSRSSFATDSADVSGGRGPAGMLPSTANAGFPTPVLLGTQAAYRLAFAGASGTTLQPGQRLTFRVYFSCGSTTTTTRFATLKNVLVKGEAQVVTGTRRTTNTTWQLYPNPATAEVLLVHPVATQETVITVYSPMGQRVATIACPVGSQQTLLDMQHLTSSQYLVHYSNGTTQFTAKLLKQ